MFSKDSMFTTIMLSMVNNLSVLVLCKHNIYVMFENKYV